MSSSPDSPSSSDVEKHATSHATEKSPHTLIDEYGENGAHMLDAHRMQAEGVKTTADGKIILIPQPSTDPNDPLNWSFAKKHIMLFVISITAFMPDFGSSMGIVTLLPQAMYVPLRSAMMAVTISC